MRPHAARARRLCLAVAATLLMAVSTAGPAAALSVADTVGGLAGDTVATVGGLAGDTVATVGGLADDTADGLVPEVVELLLDTTDDLGVTVPPAVPDTAPVPAPARPSAPPAPTPAPVPPPAAQPVAPSPPALPADTATGPAVTTPPSTPSAEPQATSAPSPRGVMGTVAQHAGVPVALIVLMVAFLALQDRIDRRDPKLALAPLQPTPELVFPSGHGPA